MSYDQLTKSTHSYRGCEQRQKKWALFFRMLKCFCCTTRSNLTLTTTFFGGHLEIKSPPHPPPRSLWRKPSAPGDYTVLACQRNEKGARGWGTRRARSMSPLLCVCHNSYTNSGHGEICLQKLCLYTDAHMPFKNRVFSTRIYAIFKTKFLQFWTRVWGYLFLHAKNPQETEKKYPRKKISP